MKRIKNLVATFALLGIIVMGASTAKAGFLASDLTGGSNTPDPCKEITDIKVDHGIIFGDFTGIIVSGFAGIIVSGYTDVSCGIMVSD